VIKQPRPNATVSEFFRELSQSCVFLLGQEIEVTTDAVLTVQKFEHGLGRAYRGAWMIWSSGASILVAQRPADHADSDVCLAVIDPAQQATTCRIWVW
jgi:hypothetical protein